MYFIMNIQKQLNRHSAANMLRRALLQLPPSLVLAISSISHDNIVLTKRIALIWEHVDIAGTKSDRAATSHMPFCTGKHLVKESILF